MNAIALAAISGAFCSNLCLAAGPIRVNVDASPVNLEPPLLTDTIASWVLFHIGDRLVEEHRPGQLQGNLAERWVVSPDHLTYRFFIKIGKKFGDGTPLTNLEVVNSLRLAKKYENGSKVSYYLKNIESVKPAAENSVEIHLKKLTANLLQVLADSCFSIYKKTGKKLLYSGEFDLVQYTPKKVVIKRRRDGQIFELQVMPYSDAVNKFKAGKLELLRNYGLENLVTQREVSPRRIVMPDERAFFVAFNAESTRFSDVKSRVEVVRHFDKAAIAAELAKSDLKPTNSLLSESFFLGKLDLQELAPESARAAPKEPFKVVMMKNHKLDHLAEAIFKGLNFKAENLDKAEFLTSLKKGAYDAMLVGYGITVRDWDYISTLLQSDSAHNIAKLKDKGVDALLDRARAEYDPAKRMDIYSQILKKNADNAWYYPVTHVPLILAVSPQINFGSETSEKIVTSPFLYLDGINWKN